MCAAAAAAAEAIIYTLTRTQRMTHQVVEFLSIQPCVVWCQPPSQFLCVVTADTTTVCVVRVHKDNRHLLLSQHNNLLQFIHVNIAFCTITRIFLLFQQIYHSYALFLSFALCIDSSISTQRNRRTTKENTMMCLIGLWITRFCIDNADICVGCESLYSYIVKIDKRRTYYWRVA